MAAVTITTIAGTGTAGFTGDNGPATNAQLNQPKGLSTDAVGNVYVMDTQNLRVRAISPSGTIRTIAGSGGTCSTSGLSNGFGPDANGICVGSGWLAASPGGAVSYNPGGWLDRIVTSGSSYHVAGQVPAGNYWPNDGAAFSVNVNPIDGTYDPVSGTLYFLENNNSSSYPSPKGIKQLTTDGQVSTIAGRPGLSTCNYYASDGQTAAGACLNPSYPILRGRSIYFFDAASGWRGPVIFRIDLDESPMILHKVAGTGSWSDYGINALANNAGISQVGPIAISSTGEVYFGSLSNGQIRKIDSTGYMRLVTDLGTTTAGLAFDPAGNLYASVPSQHRILKISGLVSPGPGTGKNLVALGDSVAAGEGINYGFVWNGSGWTKTGPDNPTWADPTNAVGANFQICHQTDYAYSRSLAGKGYTIYNMACTGASVMNGVLAQQSLDTEAVPAQVGGSCTGCDAANPLFDTHNPDVVTLTVGMDDIGFADWLKQCYQPFWDGDCNTADNDGQIESQISIAKANLRALLQEIQNRGQAAGKMPHVYLTGYYDPFPLVYPAQPCMDIVPASWVGAKLSESEVAWLRTKLDELNANIRHEASQFTNTTYVNIADVLQSPADHTFCSRSPWVYGASISAPSIFGGNGLSSNPAPYHPTPDGQQAIWQAVMAAIG